jgi:regulator of nonsense transcripts 2
MTGDPQFANLPLLSTFLKHFNRSYLGAEEKAEGLPEGMTELVPIGLQKEFREMFVGYFTAASKTLVKGHLVRCHRLWAYLQWLTRPESLGPGQA